MPSYHFKAMTNRKRSIKPAQVQAIINHFFTKEAGLQHIKDKNINKAYLIYTLWRTGRRISEVIGVKSGYERKRMPGLRPMDFDRQERTVTFHILKKNPVRTKDKTGRAKKEETIQNAIINKPPHIEEIAYDDQYFDDMIQYIDSMGIPEHARIFPYSRFWVDQFIKEACAELKIDLGVKKVYNPNTNQVEYHRIPVSAHCFRHGFSLYFLKNNSKNPNALPILQEVLCHSNINITKTYLQYDQEDKRKALNEVHRV